MNPCFALAILLMLSSCSSAGTTKPVRTQAAPTPQEAVSSEKSGPVLAVLPMKNNSGDPRLDDVGSTLSEVMSTEIAGNTSVTLIERQRIADVLGELGLSRAAVVDSLTAAKIGRLLGAQFMAFGSFAKLDGLIILTARIVRVETGEIVSALSEKAGSLGELDRLAHDAGRQMAASILKREEVAPAPGTLHLDLDLSALTHAKVLPYAVGVVIGMRDYRNRDVPKAAYALNDASAVRRYLTRRLGFREDNIIYLENPTKAQLETIFGTERDHRGRVFRSMTGQPADRTDLFVYFSGHGAPDLDNHQAYLALADTDPSYVKLNGYSRDLLLNNLSKLGARSVTVVLEACFSGNSDRGMLIHNASPLVMSAASAVAPKGVTLLASSAGDQISSWYPEKGHSAFTYFLLKAMKNEAVGTSLSMGLLMERIGREVGVYAARAYNRTQTPQVIGDGSRSLLGP